MSRHFMYRFGHHLDKQKEAAQDLLIYHSLAVRPLEAPLRLFKRRKVLDFNGT